MPYVIIQATPNVTIKHPESLLKAINQTLWASNQFAKPTDIKARLLDLEAFLVGIDDDQQAQGFVFVQIKLKAGRSDEVKNKLAQEVLECLKNTLKHDASSRVNVQYCVEVSELSAVYHKGA